MRSEIGSVAQSCCHLCYPWQRTANHFLHKFRAVPGSHVLCYFFVLCYPSHLLVAWQSHPKGESPPLGDPSHLNQSWCHQHVSSFFQKGTWGLSERPPIPPTPVACTRLIPSLSMCRPKRYFNTTAWTIYLGQKVTSYQLLFGIYLCVPGGRDEADNSSDVMTAKGADISAIRPVPAARVMHSNWEDLTGACPCVEAQEL